jgi:hypothetical protein
MMSTLFSREDYDAEWVAPMRRVLGDWSLQYPGIERDLAPVPSELSPA